MCAWFRTARPQLSHTRMINGVPLKAAALDVHTVGAGGSSIARTRRGRHAARRAAQRGRAAGPGVLRHGGEEPTVTDANVVLGRLNPDFCWAARSQIDAARSRAAIEQHIAKPQGISTSSKRRRPSSRWPTPTWRMPCASCRSSADSIPATSCWSRSAARVPCMRLGRAAARRGRRAGSAGARCAVRDGRAGERSADGLQPHAHDDRVGARLHRGRRRRLSRARSQRANGLQRRDRIDAAKLMLDRMVDARYVGQNHELTVDVAGRPVRQRRRSTAVKANFHAAHREMFGYASPEKSIELVTLPRAGAPQVARGDFDAAAAAAREGRAQARRHAQGLFRRRGRLRRLPGLRARRAACRATSFHGPAIVEQMDARPWYRRTSACAWTSRNLLLKLMLAADDADTRR